MGVPDPELLADLGNIWGGNTLNAGTSSIMGLGGAPAVASDAAIANMNSGASDPFGGNTMGASWLDRNMPSNKQLGDALGALNKSGVGKGAGAAGDRPPMPGQGQSGGVGRPSPQSLTALLQILNQRRDALLQSATGGVGAGAPQGARPTAGLLGF